MSEPFIAEIRIVPYNFAPRDWAFCDGQLVPISSNTALFSLVGTTYGGDGRTTCALPNLQERAPMHPGRGPGLTARRLGQRGGSNSINLTESQLPTHSHDWKNALNAPKSKDPQGMFPSRHVDENLEKVYKEKPNLNTNFAQEQSGSNGKGGAHDNMQPYLALNFTIALLGLYPSRS